MSNSIGLNIAFPPKRKDPLEYYQRLISEASRQGVGFVRIWLSDFSFNYYDYKNQVTEYRIAEFTKIVRIAESNKVKLLVVLFDFNELTDTDIFWEDYEHTFGSSLLKKYIKKPIDFFKEENFELGFSKFKKVRSIIPESVTAGWELFNEVDHVKSVPFEVAVAWAKKYGNSIRNFSKKPIFVSLANPLLIQDFEKELSKSGINVGLHTYLWPYKEPWMNVLYWKQLNPNSLVMETGKEGMKREDILLTLIAGYLVDDNGNCPMLWYWDEVIDSDAISDFKMVSRQIDKYKTSNFVYRGEFKSTNEISLLKMVNNLKINGFVSTIRKGLFILKTKFKSKGSKRDNSITFESDDYNIFICEDGLLNGYIEKIKLDKYNIYIFERAKISSVLSLQESKESSLK